MALNFKERNSSHLCSCAGTTRKERKSEDRENDGIHELLDEEQKYTQRTRIEIRIQNDLKYGLMSVDMLTGHLVWKGEMHQCWGHGNLASGHQTARGKVGT